MKKAACRGMDTSNFFPERKEGQAAIGLEAQMVCFRCPVRKECREYADRTGSKYGIWGGEHLSP